ncbi:hypothetical protein BC826DRAFT_69845 [Russula brevipes]|nr:hypothetical protein BC826DRAFT_69845 [Russula brevipes]
MVGNLLRPSISLGSNRICPSAGSCDAQFGHLGPLHPRCASHRVLAHTHEISDAFHQLSDVVLPIKASGTHVPLPALSARITYIYDAMTSTGQCWHKLHLSLETHVLIFLLLHDRNVVCRKPPSPLAASVRFRPPLSYSFVRLGSVVTLLNAIRVIGRPPRERSGKILYALRLLGSRSRSSSSRQGGSREARWATKWSVRSHEYTA